MSEQNSLPADHLCPTCGPTTVEEHPRRRDVGRCVNCKEILYESECTCDNPCCEVDIGVGYVNCGEQHCPQHATPENQGVPSYHSYSEGARFAGDTVEGQRISDRPHLPPEVW